MLDFDMLEKVLDYAKADHVELRFHERIMNKIKVGNGELEEATSASYSGTGIRVLIDGTWGFSSTSSTTFKDLKETLNAAIRSAKVSAKVKRSKLKRLGDAKLAKGRFAPKITDPLSNHSLEEKMKLVLETERATRKYSPEIVSARCQYIELLDRKLILSSDGAHAEVVDSKPEFRVVAVANRGGNIIDASEQIGVTGGWKELWSRRRPEEMSELAASTAIKLLDAKYAKGERTKVILDPSLVGVIAHEAFGHTVEADFVLSGSIVKDKLGKKVASELVTLVDSGPSTHVDDAGGTVLVDDEGVQTGRTVIIEHGILKSYLHDRETAGIFGIQATGNARAFEYSDEPIIRMRNTYIEPGECTKEELIEDLKHGYLLKGAGGGQADANGEFMFSVQEAYLIEDGEIKTLCRGVAISGCAIDVLSSVDGVSKEFRYDMGAGYCGKLQFAKVDGGGGYLRCTAIVGGRQK